MTLYLAPGWYYTNTENNKINWYFYGDTATTNNDLGSLSGAYAVIDFRVGTSAPLLWCLHLRPRATVRTKLGSVPV